VVRAGRDADPGSLRTCLGAEASRGVLRND
jgi:hypothetical protein